MQLEIIQDESSLVDLSSEWKALSCPSPAQSPDWLIPWWQAYSVESPQAPRRELFTLAIRDVDGRLCGIAPLYIERRRVFGKTLRLLGDGRACSDHATILCQPGRESNVIDKLASWLAEASGTEWHSIQLESVDQEDQAVTRLVEALGLHDVWIASTGEVGTCAIELPDSWETFLSLRSKNHRKRCRRWDRAYFQTGKASVRRITAVDELAAAWKFLVSLHNERRTSLGDGGAFEDPEFSMFHEQALPRLLESEQLWLQLLEIDGHVRAIEYALCDETTIYAYQSGLDSEGAKIGAGNLSLMGLIQGGIAEGKTKLDLMRGQEEYKYHWGAVEQESHTIAIRSRSLAGLGDLMMARTRDQLKRVKHLCQNGSPRKQDECVSVERGE